MDTLRFKDVPETAQIKPTPFHCSIEQSKLGEMLTLINIAKITPPTFESLDETGNFGISSAWLHSAKERWCHNFQWSTYEDNINSFPNFTISLTDRDGETMKIHFVALFSKKKDAVPLLLLHGWPGNFLEFLGILSLLAGTHTEEDLPYHVIVPSLPGYAFSSKPPLNKEFTTYDVAALMDQLMIRLGFGDGYVVQGGDIGAKIARILAAKYESSVHLNYCPVLNPTRQKEEDILDVEREALPRGDQFLERGTGYSTEQATKPSTIGLVLGSNPIALLAWIAEKFIDWSDKTPPLDTILESVSLYWLTETFPTSIYPYRERFQDLGIADKPEYYIKKPMGFSWFPKELLPTPVSWVATTGNLVFHRHHTKGGHFAALECPGELLKDIEDFITQVWKKE
ncbi:hypothetical protein VE00_11120 [Pseudogymnoascus sp. WSF 3629]|nr:hypothetical protein VE00_11120 [Pseudogymnoascus sp. WSF 3629]